MSLYTLSQKSQSLWFVAYASALLLALLTAFEAFNVISFSGLTLDNALMFSGLLFAIGAGFGFGAFDSGERKLFWRWGYVWLLSILVGLVMTLGSVVASLTNEVSMFNLPPTALFVVGLPFLLYGTILLFIGMSEETRESFGKLTILYLLLFFIGFILGILSAVLFVMTNGGFNPMSGVPSWQVFLELASVLGILGIIPLGFVMGSKDSLKETFHKAWILWAILSLIGFVMLILSIFEILTDINTVAIGGPGFRQAGLMLALVFEAPGFVFLMASTDKTDLVKKLSIIWILGIIVGLVLTFASQYVSSLPNSTVGSGLSLVILFSGLLYKAISLDYTPSAGQSVSRPARAVSSGVAVSTSTSGFEVPGDLIPEEQKVYIEMQRKVNDNTVMQLNNYAKSNKLAKSFVDRKVAELKATNAKAEDLIASITEQAKRSSRQNFFKDTVATDTQPTRQAPPTQQSRPSSTSMNTPPMSPPGPPSSPPPPMAAPKPPAPSGPPMPPSSPPGPPKAPVSSGPPMPPSSPSMPPMPPAPPSAGGPPKPPMPPGMPPAPPSAGGPPKPPGLPPMPSSSVPPVPGQPSAPGKPPGAPSGDAVGTARSTSIAELRGEMLKELRRLRDIFNEDQK